jgi:ABC-type lipoprotein export system ATPase subunit
MLYNVTYNSFTVTEWYSTGSYFWSKNLVEILPIFLYSMSYGFVSYYMSGQLFEYERLFGYIFIITFGMICTQGLGHLIGIVFMNFEDMAIVLAFAVFSNFIMFCNFYIIIGEMSQIFQNYSYISYIKYIFNSGLILIYGLDRCKSDQFSIALYKYKLSGEVFSTNAYILLIYCLTLTILSFISLYVKANDIFERIIAKKLKKIFTKSYDKTEAMALTEIQVLRKFSLIDMGINNNLDDSEENFYEEYEKCTENKISIAWIDLTLKIPKQLFTEEKVILHRIDGCFEFGSLNALMGPSGAGKTTLLKAINNMNRDLLSSETKMYLSKFERIRTCFITQDEREHLIKGLTAKQALIYASKLKNTDKGVNHENNANTLMAELLISGTADTNVENCSGGEQKRIVIAMELTSYIKPTLLCIDEPTSGLDSNAAEVVCFMIF